MNTKTSTAGRTATLPEWARDPTLASAAWSRIIEPGDEIAGALIAAVGPVDALAWLYRATTAHLVDVVDNPQATVRAAARWAPRLRGLDPRPDMHLLRHLGGTLLTPADERWPSHLGDLGPAAPPALWVRGDPVALNQPFAAVVGSRASTGYGETIAADMAIGLAEHGIATLSGGAYGIDAAAHRGALTVSETTGRATVAILAGGVDRLYPAGNRNLLMSIEDRGGAIVAEVPPGAVPARQRFLSRNRVIAALAGATVVIEAAYRSGALSTAAHAAGLSRPVGAVPGPVTSMASAGCHRLMREGVAMCVTDADEVRELLAPIGHGTTPDTASPPGLLDDLRPVARRVLDAMPARAATTADRLTRVAGLAAREVSGALGELELAGKVTRAGSGWTRSGPG